MTKFYYQDFLGVKEEIIAFEKGLSGKSLATKKGLGGKGFLLCT